VSSEAAGSGSLLTADPNFVQLRKLTEISRALTYTTSMDEVAQLTVERGADLLEASAALLMLPDSGGLLHVRSSFGIAPERVARFRAPMSDELIGRLQGMLGVADDSFLAVPLVVGGAVTGLLAVGKSVPADEADEWLLSALADQAAIALENARLGGEVRLDMEARLRLSEGATDAKDRALATLAHDIRTPLGAIEGYCELLEDQIYGPVNDKQREALGRVRMSGRHLLSLLDNVMDMATLTAGLIQVSVEPVRLSHVVHEAADMLGPACAAKLQVLQSGGAIDVVVTGDHARLRQVLVNLITNATKFTPAKGSISVMISTGAADGAQYGEIRVVDTGPGIPDGESAAIFEPYYRSPESVRVPGIGLGLAISRALVLQMGGTLTVESEPGAGATFVIRLPKA
jgi:phosphoserine phosphatase RsbU/P